MITVCKKCFQYRSCEEYRGLPLCKAFCFRGRKMWWKGKQYQKRHDATRLGYATN